MTPSLKDFVVDNQVRFSHYRKDHLFYEVDFQGRTYQFPVPVEDTGDATFYQRDKAIFFMRYIRKALGSGQLVATAA